MHSCMQSADFIFRGFFFLLEDTPPHPREKAKVKEAEGSGDLEAREP